MTLHLTRDSLAGAYDYLCATPPFDKWNLPESHEVAFKVVKDPALYGWYETRRGKHTIAVSTAKVGRTDCLVETMAHEMIHLYEKETKIDRGGPVQHSRAFRLHAAEVCKHHGFDPKRF